MSESILEQFGLEPEPASPLERRISQLEQTNATLTRALAEARQGRDELQIAILGPLQSLPHDSLVEMAKQFRESYGELQAQTFRLIEEQDAHKETQQQLAEARKAAEALRDLLNRAVPFVVDYCPPEDEERSAIATFVEQIHAAIAAQKES